MKVSTVREWTEVGDRTDKVGRVVVRVILIDRGKNKNMKGNLTRTFTVNGATVSEIAELMRDTCYRAADQVEVGEVSVNFTPPPTWGITH
jgi:hypothetical protein